MPIFLLIRIYLSVGLNYDGLGILVVVGVNKDCKKGLLAMSPGYWGEL
ncbi:MAG: hypothetical protein ABIK93_06675 [candidate division WOR-3 bacterium]